MRSFWSPLSALLLPAPRIYAPPLLLGKLLDAGKSVELIYAGDRMAPTLRHGRTIRIEAPQGKIGPGDVVVACPEGVPDVFRVAGIEVDQVWLAADADPTPPTRVSAAKILALVGSPRRRHGRLVRLMRRVLQDLREAWGERPDAAQDLSDTVRVKYDMQAVYYGASSGPEMEDRLQRWILREVPSGRRILVAGSGTGRECFALARQGYRVVGVDFSEEMIAKARAQAAHLGLSVDFRAVDLRAHQEDLGSLGAVVFTYEVYSFLSVPNERIELLRTMAAWLEPQGRIFLSARRQRGLYDALILSIQRLRGGKGRRRPWGDSHTRWIAPDGNLRRSFIHVFPERRLRREARKAGLLMGGFDGGHCLLSPTGSRSTRT